MHPDLKKRMLKKQDKDDSMLEKLLRPSTPDEERQRQFLLENEKL